MSTDSVPVGFCIACGHSFTQRDSFCSQCGKPAHAFVKDGIANEVAATRSHPPLTVPVALERQGSPERAVSSAVPGIPPTSPSSLPTATAATPRPPAPLRVSTQTGFAAAPPAPRAPAGRGPVPADAQRASVGLRMAANALDSALVFAAFLVVYVVVAALQYAASPGSIDTVTIVLSLAAFVCVVGYSVYFNGVGGTIGKRVVGVRVVDLATGGNIGTSRSFVRYMVLVLMGFPCYLGYLSPFLDRTGRLRGWHDIAAGDRVVQVPPMRPREAARP